MTDFCEMKDGAVGVRQGCNHSCARVAQFPVRSMYPRHYCSFCGHAFEDGEELQPVWIHKHHEWFGFCQSCLRDRSRVLFLERELSRCLLARLKLLSIVG